MCNIYIKQIIQRKSSKAKTPNCCSTYERVCFQKQPSLHLAFPFLLILEPFSSDLKASIEYLKFSRFAGKKYFTTAPKCLWKCSNKKQFQKKTAVDCNQ